MKATMIGRLLLAMAFFTSPFVARPALAFPNSSDIINCVSDTSGATFAGKMLFIAPGYQPVNANGAPLTGAGVPQWEKNAVASAFHMASPKFQAMLCRLDGIYVDPYNYSWGYRDRSTRNNRYIALSGALFNYNVPASFASNATFRLNRILRTSTVIPYSFYFGPTTDGGGNNIDNTSLTILAALAHEYGHIYWHDANKDAHGDYDYHFCNDNFLRQSWSDNRPPGDPWIPLGALIGEHREAGFSDNVSVQRINAALGNPQQLEPILRLLYYPEGTRWATALAAFSPVEDFVETFQNVVLTTSAYNPASQPLYNSGGALIGDTFAGKDNSSNFLAKKNCFPR
jgi:hypothetical protein